MSIVITIAGVDQTDDIMLRDAKFESMANGRIGKCFFRLKDADHSKSVVTGSIITVDIDGIRVWSGYASKVSRSYLMPVVVTSVPAAATRFLVVEGADINIILQRRVVFDQAIETNDGPLYEYPPRTSDSVALTDLFSSYVDLSGDSIDTATLVEHVGYINVDQDASPLQPSETLASSLSRISAYEGALFYINPERKLVYTDVDTPNAPFALSDNPTGGQVGYRSCEIFNDATDMANVAMVWGTALGAGHWVFSKSEDSASIGDHGRWEWAEVRTNLYRQGMVDKRTSTYVYGSPLNKRGHKDDRVSVTLTLREPGLEVGHKVAFESQVYAVSDTLPVRRMAITFPTPTRAMYEYELSHSIDVPFDFSEWYWPGLHIDIHLPPPPGGTRLICDTVGITDDFDRAVSETSYSADTPSTLGSYLGISSCGLDWSVQLLGTAAVSVDGDSAILSVGTYVGFNDSSVTATMYPPYYEWSNCRKHSVQLRFLSLWDGSIDFADSLLFRLLVGQLNLSIHVIASYDSLWQQGSGPTPLASTFSQITWTADYVNGTRIPNDFFVIGKSFAVYIYQEGDVTWGEITDYYRTYRTSIATPPSSYGPTNIYVRRPIVHPYTASGLWTVAVDYVDYPDINRGTLWAFDNFDRTEIDTWGTSDSGATWFDKGPGTYTISVNGGYGKIEQIDPGTVPNQSGEVFLYVTDQTTGWAGDFTLLTEFKIEQLPDSAWSGSLATWAIGLSEADPPTDVDHGIVMVKRDSGFGGSDSISFVWSGGSVFSKVSATWAAGETYRVRWERIGPRNRVRVWNSADPEPAVWDISSIVDDITPLAFVAYQNQPFVRTSGADPDASLRLWYSRIKFDYADGPCYVVNGDPVDPVASPVDGSITESTSWSNTEIRLVTYDYQVYRAHNMFVPGSTVVTVNGLVQRLYFDYVEFPTDGLIRFRVKLLPTDDVTVSYVSAGGIC